MTNEEIINEAREVREMNERESADHARKVGSLADRVWQVAEEIEPNMKDIARRLKEISTDLHDVRRKIRAREEIDT